MNIVEYLHSEEHRRKDAELRERNSRGVYYIYFIQSGKDGPVKIGFTKSEIEDRLGSLQTGNPEKLTILASIQCRDCTLESSLHKILKEHHIRGEWFESSPRVMAYVELARADRLDMIQALIEDSKKPDWYESMIG